MVAYTAGTDAGPTTGTRTGSGPYGGGLLTVASTAFGSRTTVASRPTAETSQLSASALGTRVVVTDRPTAHTAPLELSIFDQRGPERSFLTGAQHPTPARATLIPSAYFRTATGTVSDADGNLIENALYIVGLDDFSTLGPVDENGQFSIHLLRLEYDTFILVGDGGQDAAYDLVWYESEPAQSLSSNQNEIDLRFETEEPKPAGQLPTGVNAALEMNFGG